VKWRERDLIIKGNTSYERTKTGKLRQLSKKGDYTQYLKSAKNRRGILMLNGDLRRSIKIKLMGNQIAVYSDSPYAAIHNDGLPMKNGKPMPKRQFIGKSANLNTKLTKIINETLKSV
jgi:phage gpG-like protein